MTKVQLGSILIEQKKTVGVPSGHGLNELGVRSGIGLYVSDATRVSDLSRHKIIQERWCAYHPMRVDVDSIGLAFGKGHIGIISPEYVVFSCSDRILPEYLLCLLKSNEGIQSIKKSASGAVIKRLRFVDLARIEIVLPSIESQRHLLVTFGKTREMGNLTSEQESHHGIFSQTTQPNLQDAKSSPYKAPYRDSPPKEGCLKGGVGSALHSYPALKRNSKNYFSLPYNPKLKERAKALRKASTLSEVLFWNRVKRNQFKGLDFDRQKIIGNYIVDFYCPNHQVVVEIDGSSHDDKQAYDAARDAYLESLGLTVIHIKDRDIKMKLPATMNWLLGHPAFEV